MVDLQNSAWAVMAEEVTVNCRGQMISVISAPRGTMPEVVCSFGMDFHRRRFGRAARVWVASLNERPEAWVVNPLPGRCGELWVVAVSWGEVAGGQWPVLEEPLAMSGEKREAAV